MKNQGVWVTRIVMIAISIFAMVYMGYHVFIGLKTAIPTTNVVLMEAEEMRAVSGYFARDEVPLSMPSGLLKLTVVEGEKVFSGQVIAMTYPSAAAMQAGTQLEALQEQRDRLEAYGKSEDITVDVSKLDSQIEESLINVLNTVEKRNFTDLETQSAEWKALLFKREFSVGNSIDLNALNDVLTETINNLSQQTVQFSSVMKAPQAGLFCSSTDGLESTWKPEEMTELTVAAYKEKGLLEPTFFQGNTGKLALGLDWYFVTLVPETEELEVGKVLQIRFTGEMPTTISMTCSALSTPQDGERVAVFKTRKYLSYFINLRRSNADLLFSSYKGLRVPRESVRIDEQGHYVYCLVLQQVVKKRIDIIPEIERENYFLVNYDPNVLGSLMPNDEVITEDKDLYDGKIIR